MQMATRILKLFTVGFPICGEVSRNTAGTTNATNAINIVDPAACAIVLLNNCFLKRNPPANIDKPSTSSKFPSIEPVIEAFTTPTNPAFIANTARIISVALPKVAFKILPSPVPIWVDNSSVLSPINLAKGIIAVVDKKKIKSGGNLNSSATKARGTKQSKEINNLFIVKVLHFIIILSRFIPTRVSMVFTTRLSNQL